MRIVLNEPTHARQSSQGSRRFVSVDHTELGHTDRKLLVTPITTIEDQTVARAVHRLQRPFFFLYVKRKHIVLVVLPVAGSLPEFTVVHVRRDNCKQVILRKLKL